MSERFIQGARFLRELGFAGFLAIVLLQTTPAINKLSEKIERLCGLMESRTVRIP